MSEILRVGIVAVSILGMLIILTLVMAIASALIVGAKPKKANIVEIPKKIKKNVKIKEVEIPPSLKPKLEYIAPDNMVKLTIYEIDDKIFKQKRALVSATSPLKKGKKPHWHNVHTSRYGEFINLEFIGFHRYYLHKFRRVV